MPEPYRSDAGFAHAADAPSGQPAGSHRQEQRPPARGSGRSGGARRTLSERFASDTEFMLLAGTLIALCVWFALSSGPKNLQSERPLPATSAGASLPPTFSYVATSAKDLLVVAMSAAAPRPAGVSLPTQRPAEPSAAATVEQHALLTEPLSDPLGSFVLSGLPPSTRLSAGAEISPAGAATSDWAVAIGDLDNLVITLPPGRPGPVRATLDLLTRAGMKITSLTVELRTAPGGAVAGAGAVKSFSTRTKVKPAKAARPASTTKSKRTTQGTPTKPVVAQPATPSPGEPARQAPPQAAAKPVAPLAILPAPPLLVPGFFKPDPKDSASSGLSPALRDDPRFTTLRGLGMAPSEAPPPEIVPPATP